MFTYLFGLFLFIHHYIFESCSSTTTMTITMTNTTTTTSTTISATLHTFAKNASVCFTFVCLLFVSHGCESLREVAGPMHGHHEKKHC